MRLRGKSKEEAPRVLPELERSSSGVTQAAQQLRLEPVVVANSNEPTNPPVRIYPADLKRNVYVKDRTFHMIKHKRCFIAREAVDWLVAEAYCSTRCGAMRCGQSSIRWPNAL